MTVFAWTGVDQAGKAVKGRRDAENAKNLRLQLRKEGIYVTKVNQESGSKQSKIFNTDIKRLLKPGGTSQSVALATRQLATLLRSGITLVDGLSAMIEQIEDDDLKSAYTQTRTKVNEGISLADALGEHPRFFSGLYVNMVAAGEASGNLEAVLGRLADFLEAQNRLRNKVTSAMAYPIFMALMGVAVISLMMIVVVPKVTSIFDDFNQALPWYTSVLIGISNFVSGFWWLIVILIGGGIYFFRRWKKTEQGRKRWDIFVLSVPVLGQVVILIAISRFARTLATLLASGVPMLTAMDITRRVLGNTELMRVVEEARASVREGESIAAPLKRSGRFPPIVTHMIAIGERSGQLEEMLENVANAYDDQVEARLTTLTSLLEPLMIVVMGGAAGGIAFAILMPLMKISEFVQ